MGFSSSFCAVIFAKCVGAVRERNICTLNLRTATLFAEKFNTHLKVNKGDD